MINRQDITQALAKIAREGGGDLYTTLSKEKKISRHDAKTRAFAILYGADIQLPPQQKGIFKHLLVRKARLYRISWVRNFLIWRAREESKRNWLDRVLIVRHAVIPEFRHDEQGYCDRKIRRGESIYWVGVKDGNGEYMCSECTLSTCLLYTSDAADE